MNILFFYESMNLGGQQTQTYYLIKRMAAAGHRMSWAYLSGTGMEAAVGPHAELHHIPVPLGRRDYLYKPWRLLQITGGLVDFCRDRRIDVIISGSGIGSLLCGWAARRVGCSHFRLMGCSLIEIEKMLYRTYRLTRIDRVIDGYFGWPAVFDELRSKGVGEDKFFELQNAVDTDVFRPLPDEERRAFRAGLGIADDELVLGWIGRVAANMQCGNTLKLGELVRDRGFTRFKLLFVGGGPWLDTLKQLAEQAGLTPQCIFTDWVPMNDVPRYASAMDIVPLLEADPQGGSIVREAMSCGSVALSVDGPTGTQRRFMPPEAAVLVPAKDYMEEAAKAVVALGRDPAAREALGRAARAYCEQHMTFDAQVRIILAACEAHRRRRG